jgi:hypothetical protein
MLKVDYFYSVVDRVYVGWVFELEGAPVNVTVPIVQMVESIHNEDGIITSSHEDFFNLPRELSLIVYLQTSSNLRD